MCPRIRATWGPSQAYILPVKAIYSEDLLIIESIVTIEWTLDLFSHSFDTHDWALGTRLGRKDLRTIGEQSAVRWQRMQDPVVTIP